MSSPFLGWVLSILLLLVACEAPLPEPPAVQPHGTAALTATRDKAVLIAGTGSLPVWDNAVEAVAARLRERGSVDIQRLSAAHAVVVHGGARAATLNNVLDAIGSMKPGPGEGCFVFATSNGHPGGLTLSMTGEVLSPFDLDRALVRGCGGAPTVIVISGCYTGVYARSPMNRANRVVLTASRPDRTSFGCSPGRTYTAYDTCLLYGLDAGGTWSQAYVAIQHCVIAGELPFGLAASEPQAWLGPAVADMPLPVATRDDIRPDAR
jgi:hypothetical protein